MIAFVREELWTSENIELFSINGGKRGEQLWIVLEGADRWVCHLKIVNTYIYSSEFEEKFLMKIV